MTSPKRPGRPPLDDSAPSAAVNLRLAARDYDEVYRLAKQRRESVQDVIRRGVKRVLNDESAGI